MYYLSKEQISVVSNKLKSESINYSHLFDDLLDHICSDIECLMQKGESFSNAYTKVFYKIGLDGLKEIQEATIFYVKLNLIVMKKFLNVTGITSSILITVGLLFKMNHWPGASFLLLFGMLIFFGGFLPVGLLNIRKVLGIKLLSKSFIGYLLGALVLIESGTAILFRLNNWPGGNWLSLISMLSIFFVFFPIVFYKILKTDQIKVVPLSIAMFSFFFFGFITLTNINQSKNVSYLNGYENLKTDIQYLQSELKTVHIDNSLKSEDFVTMVSLFGSLLETIEGCESAILADKENIYAVNKSILHTSHLVEPDNPYITTLKSAIENYRKAVLKLTDKEPGLSDYINKKLNTKTYSTPFDTLSWEKFYFSVNDVSKYQSLYSIKRDIYNIRLIAEKLYMQQTKAPE